MCDRFTLNIPADVLTKTFDLAEVPEYELRYNIAPNQHIVTIRNSGNKNRSGLLKWGLTPGEQSENHLSSTTACSETVNADPPFCHAIRYSRCIIPASGFYKWFSAENNKRPYYIRLANSSLMGFAGLWERWETQDGSECETCCILTTEANELIRPVNDRMPVIIQPDSYNLWLDSTTYDLHDLQDLFEPYPSDLMVAYPVPELVNNPRFDSASCIVHM